MTSDPAPPAAGASMGLEQYLAQGGVLTAPANAPPRYRAELMRLMARFVDSSLAGSAGFADVINQAPGLKARIAASRIVLEKTDHAERVLAVMAGFGADTGRYATRHPWAARLARDTAPGVVGDGRDMRLAVFHYPLAGWADAVTMNVLMGRAVVLQLTDLALVSYQPLAEAFRAILPRERRHADLGEEGLRALMADPAQAETVAASVGYWWPRVEASFGPDDPGRFAQLRGYGLRRVANAALARRWRGEMAALLGALGVPHPP